MKTTKRIITALLCITLLLSTGITCFAVSEPATVDEETTTNRYYFYMPEIWKNEYTDTAGIYYWEGTDACDSWPGYKAHETEVKGVFYYDVPKDVTTIIWNNYLDGGFDEEEKIYHLANQTNNICSEFYFPDESEAYPEGVASFDGMIFVTDFRCYTSDYSGKATYDGEWYYYYGNGEYGLTPEKSEVFCKNSYLVDPLESGEFALLDVNADGSINVKDATVIQKYCAKLIDLDEAALMRTNGWYYDLDENKMVINVTVREATYIQKFVANLLYIHGEIKR